MAVLYEQLSRTLMQASIPLLRCRSPLTIGRSLVSFNTAFVPFH